jgi:perosamine synthetase
MGTMSTFSFYANKLITTGEGGMVVTDDPALADWLRSARNLFLGTDRRFEHEDLGWNARLTNMQAALGLSQLKRMQSVIERKREIAARYSARLADVVELQLPPSEPWARSVYWMYGVVVREDVGMDARTLAAGLLEQGIETRPFFSGMHEQPVFKRRGMFAGESYPVAEGLSRRGLYLPSGLALTDRQMDEVASALKAMLG